METLHWRVLKKFPAENIWQLLWTSSEVQNKLQNIRRAWKDSEVRSPNLYGSNLKIWRSASWSSATLLTKSSAHQHSQSSMTVYKLIKLIKRLIRRLKYRISRSIQQFEVNHEIHPLNFPVCEHPFVHSIFHPPRLSSSLVVPHLLSSFLIAASKSNLHFRISKVEILKRRFDCFDCFN